MGLPPSSTSSAGKASARARLVVVLAGAAPARTGTVALRPSLPFAAEGGRFAGGGRRDGDQGGGAARLAGAAMCTALRRPAAPAFKKATFSSYGGARLAGRAMYAALRLPAAKPYKNSTFYSYGGARLAGRATYAALRLPAAKPSKNSAFSSYGGAAVLCLARRVDGEEDGAGVVEDGRGGVGVGVMDDGAGAGVVERWRTDTAAWELASRTMEPAATTATPPTKPSPSTTARQRKVRRQPAAEEEVALMATRRQLILPRPTPAGKS